MIFALTLSFNGVKFDGEIVPYFFLNYKELGWLSISSNGIGVVYWVIILTILVLAIEFVLLKIKDFRCKKAMLDKDKNSSENITPTEAPIIEETIPSSNENSSEEENTTAQ